MIKIISTPKAPAAIGPYSQARSWGGFIYISGQLPVVPETGVFISDNIAGQTQQSCRNIGAILESVGLGFQDVIKTTCYLSDMADFAEFNSVYEKYFEGSPARSCVAVKTLPKNALVEIEAIAVTEKNQS